MVVSANQLKAKIRFLIGDNGVEVKDEAGIKSIILYFFTKSFLVLQMKSALERTYNILRTYYLSKSVMT